MIDITAISTSPSRAVTLAQRSASALTSYVRDQQQASRVPVDDRAVIQPVIHPGQVQLFRPRSKTMPIVVFAAVMFVTVGLVFILENLRPRRQPPMAAQTSLEDTAPPTRRSA
jgi:capsular polysaccharide biosynthesis protein